MVLQILFDLPELFGIFVFTLTFGEAFLEFKNALAKAFANFGWRPKISKPMPKTMVHSNGLACQKRVGGGEGGHVDTSRTI